jgi:DNA-binding transcriptional LysR family regulator
MLDVNRLAVLVEIAERGSFSAAAEALFMTQPGVSRHVAALEREAGAQLVERLPRGARLTQAGEVAVTHARAILARIAAAESELEALAGLESGRLRMAAFASANTALIPEVVATFSARYPGVELTLGGQDPGENLAAVRRAELDLALVTDWDLEDDTEADSVELIELLEDPLLVALAKDHRLAERKRLRLADLSDEVWIEGAHPDCLGPLEQLCEAVGFSPKIGFKCDDWNGKQGLVAATVGITIFPALALATLRPDVTVRWLTPRLPPRRVLAALPLGNYRAPGVAPMLSLLEAAGARHQTQVPT